MKKKTNCLLPYRFPDRKGHIVFIAYILCAIVALSIIVGFDILRIHYHNSIAVSNAFNRSSNSLTIHYGLIEACEASWYGPGFHGRTTANGEIYDQHKHTAAHKRLEFNTTLYVEGANSRGTIVRINDRGPFIQGRCIDLSYAAFKDIADPNVGKINVMLYRIKPLK